MCSLVRAATPQKGPRGNACNTHRHIPEIPIWFLNGDYLRVCSPGCLGKSRGWSPRVSAQKAAPQGLKAAAQRSLLFPLCARRAFVWGCWHVQSPRRREQRQVISSPSRRAWKEPDSPAHPRASSSCQQGWAGDAHPPWTAWPAVLCCAR